MTQSDSPSGLFFASWRGMLYDMKKSKGLMIVNTYRVEYTADGKAFMMIIAAKSTVEAKKRLKKFLKNAGFVDYDIYSVVIIED